MQKLNGLDWLCLILTVIGGINWGLIGFFDYNFVDAIFTGAISRVIYGIVGLCALYLAFLSPKLSRKSRAGERIGGYTQERVHAVK